MRNLLTSLTGIALFAASVMFSARVQAQVPKVQSFVATTTTQSGSSITVNYTKTFTLSWDTIHADWVDINGDVYPATGSLPVSASSVVGDTATYILTAHQGTSPATDTATVYVFICVQPNCDGGPLNGKGKGKGH